MAVNIKNKKILSEVTDEHVHNGKVLPELIENIVKSGTTTIPAIGKLFADGAHDSNDIFKYIVDKGIFPCIKVRKNAKSYDKGNILESISIVPEK